jgi:hypothetical protein
MDVHENCEGYCTSLRTADAPLGRACVNAFEDTSDTCTVKQMDELSGSGASNCAFKIDSSDIICECGAPLTGKRSLDAQMERLSRLLNEAVKHR